MDSESLGKVLRARGTRSVVTPQGQSEKLRTLTSLIIEVRFCRQPSHRPPARTRREKWGGAKKSQISSLRSPPGGGILTRQGLRVSPRRSPLRSGGQLLLLRCGSLSHLHRQNGPDLTEQAVGDPIHRSRQLDPNDRSPRLPPAPHPPLTRHRPGPILNAVLPGSPHRTPAEFFTF